MFHFIPPENIGDWCNFFLHYVALSNQMSIIKMIEIDWPFLNMGKWNIVIIDLDQGDFLGSQ